MKKLLIITMLLAAGLSAAAQKGPKDWAKFNRYEQTNQTVNFIPRAVFMGDSITDNWARMDADFFTFNNFVGRGISGQTSSHMLVRFRRDVLDLAPEYVVILAGTNDIAQNNGLITLDNILGNIMSMCELARLHDIKPILCSVLPAYQFKWRKELRPAEDIIKLNEMIKEYAQKSDIPYVDYHSALKDERNGLPENYANDGVHPNHACYRIMEGLILKSFPATQEVSVARYKDGKKRATSFTFDDGNRDNYTIAAPELEKRGMRGTFWLNCATVQGEVQGKDYRMTWDDICDLHRRGHEMSNHGWSHKNLTKLSPEEVKAEIEKNDSAIFVHTGVKPVTFCFAYNARNKELEEIASKGRVGTRMFEYAFGEMSPDSDLREKLHKTIGNCDWAVWMTHGITSQYDHFKDTSRFTAFLDYVKKREEQIWIGTFKEVAAYIAERDAVRLDVVRKGKKLTVTPSLELDAALFDMPLTMCITNVSALSAIQDGKKLAPVFQDGKAFIDFNPHGGKISITLK